MNRLAPILLAALALPACETVSDTPILAVEGTAVALDQAVALGQVALTPMQVIEDSRCPMNARCVWAGRIVVRTRIDGPGWRETRDLELGEAQRVRDYRVTLTSAVPHTLAGRQIDSAEYRFTYEGGSTGVAPD